MCAKSITGRTQSSRAAISHDVVDRAELAHAAHHLDPERQPRDPFPRAARAARRAARHTESIASSRVRPSRNPGWKTTASAPAALAMPAEWSSIPTAMFSFLPRSAWPMKPAIGACTDRAMSCSRASSPKRGREVVVHPEPALEVDLARRHLLGEQRVDGRLGRLPRREPERAEVEATRPSTRDSDAASGIAAGSASPSDGISTLEHMSQLPVTYRSARARYRPAARRSLAGGRGHHRLVARRRRGLHARRLRQGLLRRAHRGLARLALCRSRLPRARRGIAHESASTQPASTDA